MTDPNQLTAIVAQGLLDRALQGGDRLAPGDERAAKLLDEAIVQFRRALAQPASVQDRRAQVLLQFGLARALLARPWGERPDDAEEAREQLEAALRNVDEAQDRQLWLVLQHNLGRLYQNRVVGDIAENRELAVQHLQAALAASADQNPDGRGKTLSQLGNALTNRLRGDREDNLDQALRSYEEALRIRTRERDPVGWAIVQHNRGLLYYGRRRGERRENLRRAIDCYSQALQVRTREALPEHWAMTRRALGQAYLALGDRKSVEAAELCFRDALTVYRRELAPMDWVLIQGGLAEAAERRGDLDTAHEILREVLRFPLSSERPSLWATLQGLYGNVAIRRAVAAQDRAELQRGLNALQRALDRWRRDGDLLQVRRAAIMLGAYLQMIGRHDEAAAAYLAGLDADAQQYAASISLASREIEIEAGGDLPVRAATALVRTGAFDRAVTVLEQGRARLLGDALARDRADLGSLLAGAASTREAARRFLEVAARIRMLEAVERAPSLLG